MSEHMAEPIVVALVVTLTASWLLGVATFSQPKDVPMPPPLSMVMLW